MTMRLQDQTCQSNTSTAADSIRILIATDSHVGYNERDSIRGDDSWKTFHEVMCLAKDQDVSARAVGLAIYYIC